MSTEIKKEIQKAILDFSSGNLTKNALSLFSRLGYNTERQASFTKPTYADFSGAYAEGNAKFRDDKAMVKEWKYVDRLFQLSKDEVTQQNSLFDTKRVDNRDIQSYLFFVIELAGNTYSRTLLAQITREVNRLFPMPVMILFKTGNNLTLSVINRRLHKRDESKDVLEKVTLIKDISIDAPHPAHILILLDLSFHKLLEKFQFTNFIELHNAWQKTLDTKELNKRFYHDLSNWYFWAMQNVSFPADIERDESVRNATNLIRLITRVIFVWFIKEKNLVPDKIFKESEVKNILKDFKRKKLSNSYYRAILQNLFFGTLNQKMIDRRFAEDNNDFVKKDHGLKTLFRYKELFAIDEKEVIALFSKVPFLNGGLFDCLDKDDPDSGKHLFVDGFTRKADKQATLPDYLFFSNEQDIDLNETYGTKNKKYTVKGLIDILDAYKFTVAENTPIEEEVALDPELLGKVFENLLASYNPETQTTARNQTGSFYTPREIVNYMVDESLKAYLQQTLSDKFKKSAEDLRINLDILFSYSEKECSFSEKERKALIEAIDKCKILDPACGSGAFPMGILHKLVLILHKLDKDNALWREQQRQKAIRETEEAFKLGNKEERENKLIEISDVFDNNSDEYGRKLYLIENCIYGVDIQAIAVQIAKLRFFISLIVDQNKREDRDNLGIRSLPNLETKFVSANTLIRLEKPEQQTNLFENKEISKLEGELKELRHRYFSAKNRKDKLACQKEDKALRQRIAKLLEQDGWKHETAKRIVSFDPYDQNMSSTWFDEEWMFGLKATDISSGPFDVVIGNPPYGLLNKKQNKAESIIVSEEDLEYFKKSEYYEPATGGMLNIFRLFILRSIYLLKTNGAFSEIFPLAFVGDLSISRLRKFILANTQILSIEAFPERDNPNTRVFEAVKMSVCILTLKRSAPADPFFIRMNNNRFIDVNADRNYLDLKTIKLLDSFNCSFPLTSSKETAVLNKLFLNSFPFSKYGRCITGEIDMTFCKTAFSMDSSNPALLKGAIIDRYLLRSKMSQGEIVFVDEKKLSRIKNIDSLFKTQQRIVLQGITGVNEKIRLKMMIIDNAYCANSLNYLHLNSGGINPFALLGILNSTLLNFVFSKFSTNSNVNGYEVDNLPIRADDTFMPYLGLLARAIIYLKKANLDSSYFERLIDALVYELFLPTELKTASCEIVKHLPSLSKQDCAMPNNTLKNYIGELYKVISVPTHPINKAIFKMETIEEIRIIEGKQ